MDKGWRLEKSPTATSTDAVKILKRKKKTSVKKKKRGLRKSFIDADPPVEEVKKTLLTVCIKGFDPSLPEQAITTALTDHFGSCGEIDQVMVPEQSASYGFAHLSLETTDEDMALALDGSLLGEQRLEVRRAIYGPFHRCTTCPYRMGRNVVFTNRLSWEKQQVMNEMLKLTGSTIEQLINKRRALISMNHT